VNIYFNELWRGGGVVVGSGSELESTQTDKHIRFCSDGFGSDAESEESWSLS
jgi:hypothetical protein